MTDLAKLVVKLEAESSKLTKELAKANKRASSWERKTKKNISGVKKAFVGLGLGIAAIKFTSFINESIKIADNIGKMSDALGLTTSQFQELAFAADIAGVNQKQFTSNMTAFVKRVGEARAETGPLVTFFQKYDKVLLENIKNSTSQEQALDLVADAMKSAATATDRAAIANAAFSRGGVTMVNMLENGAAGVKKYRDRAQELGLVIDEQIVRNAEAANDKITILTTTLKLKAVSAVVQYSKEIGNLSDNILSFIDAAAEAPKFIKYLAESFAAFVEGPADPVRIGDRIAVVESHIKSLNGVLEGIRTRSGAEGVIHWAMFGSGSSTKEKLAAYNEELDKLQFKLKLFTKPGPVPALPARGVKGEGNGESNVIAAKEEEDNIIFEMEEALHAKLAAARQASVDLRIDLEKKYTAIAKNLREGAQNHAVGLLAALGQKSKFFAAAAIVTEKVLAAQRVLMQSKVAAMAALTAPPIGLGPVAGQGLSASILASGYTTAGLIAATGAVQLSNLSDGGGGVPPGSAANPINTTSATAGQAAPGVPQTQSTIILVGLNEAEMDSVLDRAEAQINGGSRVIIRRDSPQAQEIMQAASFGA